MDDSNSDCELVIDESIILSSDEDELKPNANIYQGNIFHPVSISASDMKEELFHEDTNTCSICNETFRYNVGLIYHLEMEHVELKIGPKSSTTKKSKKKKLTKKDDRMNTDKPQDQSEKRNVKVLNRISTDELMKIDKLKDRKLNITPSFERKSCKICKKIFADQIKWTKHVESCSKIGIKFHCMYCKCTFAWESRYKKHLFKIHKLNAAVICKDCSKVFSTMTEMASHSEECSKQIPEIEVNEVE